jgi:uncharacterized protein YkwD
MTLWQWLRSLLYGDRGDPGPPPLAAPATLGMLGPHNDARRAAGVGPLVGNAALERVAMTQAAECARRGRIVEVDAAGRGIGPRAAAAGYRYWWVEENHAAGYPTAMATVEGWLRSPGHRANLLSPVVVDFGAGTAMAADGTPYWVACYGEPAG